jgi:dihydropteroate synthase
MFRLAGERWLAYTGGVTMPFQWNTARTLVMGILNVTPDSFSDGGDFADAERAVAHARAMVADGADMIDVGGESTRPGSAPVSEGEELRRVLPVVEQLRGVTISVDTTKAVIAERALAAGARIVNDISALRFDARMVEVVRDAGAGVVLMHMQGAPGTMQVEPRYDDVVAEVRDFLAERIAFAESRGIKKSQIAVDPGIGFGKTVAHNVALLSRLEVFASLGCPIVVGASRKSFIGKILAAAGTQPEHGPKDRLAGSVAVAAWAAARGAGVLRVHDVAETVGAVRVIEAVQRK